jgi:hypothetical protein
MEMQEDVPRVLLRSDSSESAQQPGRQKHRKDAGTLYDIGIYLYNRDETFLFLRLSWDHFLFSFSSGCGGLQQDLRREAGRLILYFIVGTLKHFIPY